MKVFGLLLALTSSVFAGALEVKREPSTNFGPHLQLPLPNSNDNSFVELTTTLQLPKLKADGLYYMALWPSFSTVDEPSGDIIIHKTSALSTDNYHFPCHDENLKDKWCVLTDVYRWNGATDPVGTEVLGAAIPIPVGSAVDIHYLWHADIGNMTQTASVGGQIISNISYQSPKMTKFGVDVDADESISGTVNSHSYVNTTIRLAKPEPNLPNLLKANGITSSEFTTPDHGLTWKINHFHVSEHTFVAWEG